MLRGLLLLLLLLTCVARLPVDHWRFHQHRTEQTATMVGMEALAVRVLLLRLRLLQLLPLMLLPLVLRRAAFASFTRHPSTAFSPPRESILTPSGAWHPFRNNLKLDFFSCELADFTETLCSRCVWYFDPTCFIRGVYVCPHGGRRPVTSRTIVSAVSQLVPGSTDRAILSF